MIVNSLFVLTIGIALVDGECTLCSNGSPPPLPENDLTPIVQGQGYDGFLEMVGITHVSCAMVPTLLPLIPSGLNATQCDHLQEAGAAVCGCAGGEATSSDPAKSPSRGCPLCVAGVDPSRKGADVSDLFGRFQNVTTCQDVTTLQVNLTEDGCREVQQTLSGLCGCDDANQTANSTEPDRGKQANPVECTLCWDGSEPALSKKDMSRILTESRHTKVHFASLNHTNVTCGQLDILLPMLGDQLTDSSCGFIQAGLGGVCGCPPVPSYCDFCPNDPEVPWPDTPFPYSRYEFDTELSCREISDAVTQLNEDDFRCYRARLVSFVCGCNGGERQYFGTNSTGQRAALAWIPRVSGLLSLLGSVCIVVDVLVRYSKKKTMLPRTSNNNQARPVYDSLVGAMAGFDAITSICWILSSAPTWKHDRFGGPSGVYGALGNEATCSAQGFVLQFSAIASLFYNVALSVYYLLVIVYSVREERIKKHGLGLLLPPIAIATVVAVRGLPHYTTVIIVCSIPPPPQGPSWKAPIWLLLVPIAFCLAVATALTSVIYMSVRKKLHASRRYDFAFSTSLQQSNRASGQTSRNSDDSSTRSLAAFRDAGSSEHAGTVTAQAPRTFGPIQTLQKSWRVSRSATSNHDKALSQVFWQCFFYLAALLVSYPVWFAATILSDTASYSLWVVVVIFTPLQGFLNFLVYARSRLSSRHTARKRQSHMKHRKRVPDATQPEQRCMKEVDWTQPVQIGEFQQEDDDTDFSRTVKPPREYD
jgi:hypothetical protein